MRKHSTRSWVYLLHFERKFWHAQHYMGTASDVEVRTSQHGLAQGAKLMMAVKRAGITWHVARVWEGGRKLERELKLQHNGPRWCPECQQERIAKKLWGEQ